MNGISACGRSRCFKLRFLDKRLRHEHKYYLHQHEYLTLRSRVSRLLSMDKHSIDSDGYVIRSLYFDGVHDQALYDKQDGIFSREKYRIRTYNNSDETIKLERKSKYGEYVSKESAALTREQYERIMIGDYDCLQGEEPLIHDFRFALVHRGFRPAVIVQYTREAYVYDLGDVRVTFDKKLSAVVNGFHLFDDFGVALDVLQDARTIMELKYNQFLPESVRQLVQPGGHQRSTISKYVLCREIAIRHHKP